MTGQARQGAAANGSGPLRFFCRGPHRRAAIKAAPTRTDTLSVGRGLAPAAVPQGPNTSRPRRRKVRSRRDALAWASLPPLPCSSSPQPTHCVGLGWGPQQLGGQKTGPLPMAAPLAVPSVVTPHTLRHGALLTAPQKTPCAFGTTAFLSARRAVRLLPGIQRFALLEVEESVHTQVLRHVALVVAKSAPVGTPLPGHPSLRSLAPPLPNRPTALGSVGDPRSWATQKAGPLPLAVICTQNSGHIKS